MAVSSDHIRLSLLAAWLAFSLTLLMYHPLHSRYSEVSFLELDKFLEDVR